MKSTVSCIIPFFNEGERILPVLETLTKVKGIAEIICVDDGSTDKTSELIRHRFGNQIKIISLKKNLGKAEAIRHSLKFASGEFIITVDADIRNLQAITLQESINKITNGKNISMIILKRDNNLFDQLVTRNCILLSAERIYKKSDLEDFFNSKNPYNLQLEFALNAYMMEKNKPAYYIDSTSKNITRIRKLGLIEGTISSAKSLYSYLSYEGPISYLRQIIFFCRRELN